MPFLSDFVLDLALAELDTAANVLHVCSQEPTTYTEAITTYTLGNKTSLNVGAPADRVAAGGGRRVTVAAITDGTITATGTATHYAIVDTVGTRLLGTRALAASQAVTDGNTLTLAAFDIGIPDAV